MGRLRLSEIIDQIEVVPLRTVTLRFLPNPNTRQVIKCVSSDTTKTNKYINKKRFKSIASVLCDLFDKSPHGSPLPVDKERDTFS